MGPGGAGHRPGGRLAAALGTAAADRLPTLGAPDAAAVLRQQARRLFDALVRSEDQTSLSFLAQLLARLAGTKTAER